MRVFLAAVAAVAELAPSRSDPESGICLLQGFLGRGRLDQGDVLDSEPTVECGDCVGCLTKKGCRAKWSRQKCEQKAWIWCERDVGEATAPEEASYGRGGGRKKKRGGRRKRKNKNKNKNKPEEPEEPGTPTSGRTPPPGSLWVSPGGSDRLGDGSADKPFRSLARAVREGPPAVWLASGQHRWSPEEGLVEGAKDLLITGASDAVVTGAEEVDGWSESSGVWCADSPPVDQLWVGGRLQRQAEYPNTDGNLDATDWPAPEDPTHRPEPPTGHAWDFKTAHAMTNRTAELSPPYFCATKCSPGCQKLFGGPGCPDVRRDAGPCGVNIGWLQDTRFEDQSKDYTGGLLDITLCSARHLQEGIKIVKHDHQRGRIQFDYSEESCDPEKPDNRKWMWEGMIQCWKKDAWKLANPTYWRVRSPVEMDRPGEWWASEGRVCLRSTSRPAEVTARTTATQIHVKGSLRVTVAGLRFFAAEVKSTVSGTRQSSGQMVANSADIVFQDLVFAYPGLLKLSGGAALVNSEVRYGRGVEFSGWPGKVGKGMLPGLPCRLENSLLEHSWEGATFWDCAGAVVKRNTLYRIYNGNQVQIYFGKAGKRANYDGGVGPLVAENRLTDVGFHHHCDCSIVQTRWGAYRNIQHRNNWMAHSGPLKATRFDTSDNGGDVYQNVWWKTRKGIFIKGGMKEGNRVAHNTGFSNKDCDYTVVIKEAGSGSTTPGKPYNHLSKVWNNLGDDWADSGKKPCVSPACPLPCQSSGNSKHYKTCLDWPPVAEMLRDPGMYDFRPRLCSGAHCPVGSGTPGLAALAPGSEQTIGAYEARGNHYFMPGRLLVQASSPVPPQGAPGVQPGQALMWSQGVGSDSSQLVRGRDFCSVVRGDATETFAWPANIASSAPREPGVHFWRVDSVGKEGRVRGRVWCFNVASSPQLTSPWNMVTGVDACASLDPADC